jgi:sterol desaturase/sphingolipid hydroxylase (fatty acid hydroxylase superfamily)
MMPNFTQEPLVRSVCFLSVLAIMGLWEQINPSRPLSVSKSGRWLSNLSLVALNTILLRIFLPWGAVGWAAIAEEQKWGLCNQLELPAGLEIMLSLLILDLLIYSQHVIFHTVPFLWQLHKVHHADPDCDVSTGLRFHPLEILLSMGLKMAAIALWGTPPLAVLIFEVLLNATAMFNHSNISFPPALERLLRWVIVTPDMHRIHHSVIPQETNSNYGFNLPWWDYWCGTYRAEPAQGYQGMTIGLREYQHRPEVTQLPMMLILPFDGQGSRTE